MRFKLDLTFIIHKICTPGNASQEMVWALMQISYPRRNRPVVAVYVSQEVQFAVFVTLVNISR